MKRKTDFDWTDEQIARLRQMDADGKSLTDIAAAFGVNRGAVSGKRYRLGLPHRPQTERQPIVNSSAVAAAVKSTRKRKRKTPQSIVNGGALIARIKSAVLKPGNGLPPPRQVDLPMVSGPVHLLDLQSGLCRWPVGVADGDALFCGGKVVDGPYCDGHARIAFLPRKPRALRRRGHSNHVHYDW